MTLHTYTPNQFPYQVPTSYTLQFTARPPTHPDTMGENNTPTALKGCGVKMKLFTLHQFSAILS